jgi:hypothetical protein
MKRRAYVFVNTEAETRMCAVDVIKLIVALHSYAVKSLDIRAILECDTVVTFDDKQRCHHLTPLPKKCLVSERILYLDQELLLGDFIAVVRPASTSCLCQL